MVGCCETWAAEFKSEFLENEDEQVDDSILLERDSRGADVGAKASAGGSGGPARHAQVEAQPLAKRGYDYYKAQSDMGTATVQTKDGVIGPFRVINVRDAGSGMSTGKRMHKPMVITKEIDSSSPLLAAAVARGGAIPGIVIAFDAPSKDAARAAAGGGAGVGKVNVQDIHFISVRKISETQGELTFEYASMTVTSRAGGIMSETTGQRISRGSSNHG